MWDYIFKMAKAQGLNTIQTYVFWNLHERVQGKYDFSGNGNLSLFLQTAADNGLFVNLRIGPYVCAEWAYGGLPVWLNQVPGISFRAYNMPWILEMYRFVADIVDYAKPYLASNGGPIILAQIENEYNDNDMTYVNWCGQVVDELNLEIPWIMCNGKAANNTIETCNSCNCFDDGWVANHPLTHPDQPMMFTENEGWFQQWGQAKALRVPTDLAYSVATWIASGGAYHSYYMWHGGNNYGLTAGSGITTMYADDCPLHSDGTANEPKYSHLAQLHSIAMKYSDVLLSGNRTHNISLPWWNGGWQKGNQQWAYDYQDSFGDELIFIINQAPNEVVTLYKDTNFTLAALSVQIFDAELDLLYDSSSVSSKIVVNNTKIVPVTTAPFAFKAWSEPLNETSPVLGPSAIPTAKSSRPLEQLNFTNYDTAYMWYRSNITLTFPYGTPIITVDTRLANALVFFLDGIYIGQWADYSHQQGAAEAYINFNPMQFGPGRHLLEILSVTLGIDNGVWANNFEYKGIVGLVQIAGNPLSEDWVHQKGLAGEYLKIYTAQGANSVKWNTASVSHKPVTWYTVNFTLPSGLPDMSINPMLLHVTGMGRGHAYLNGHDLGIYWTLEGSCSTSIPCCCQQEQVGCWEPTQALYHMPPDWLEQPGTPNVLTFFEELGATNPSEVRIVQRVSTHKYY
eukprot:TRINITY_DN1727_c0_g1_i1.p1 TRINITY_DN1727_c0_g1~~TRINITY_DN1727_c0_g1_i1.p1  ORF type:complete len:771 (+),score=128.12 TRINITY_DN1727_c0_g1_i1:272-2314(+)